MSFNQTSTEHHPLSTAHFRRIHRRNPRVWKRLRPIWGVTWNLKGRTMCRVGSASMMVLSYHQAEKLDCHGHMIELLCVSAETNPAKGSIHYSDIQMAHDFSLTPVVGGMNRTLDPRDEYQHKGMAKRGDRPNATWVRLGMEVDRLASKAVEQNWKLAAVPVLPTFYAGFHDMRSVDMEITPALLRDIAAHMGRHVSEIESMHPDELRPLAMASWDDLWRAPDATGNETGLWLINTAYLTRLSNTPHLFEDFSGMLGVEVWNPVRDITSVTFDNPTYDCAEENGIDLQAVLQVTAAGGHASDVSISTTVDGVDDNVFNVVNGRTVKRVLERREYHDSCETDGEYDPTYSLCDDASPAEAMTPTRFECTYDEAVDQLLYLRNCVRGSLGAYSVKFSDAEIDFAVRNPETELTMPVRDLLKDLGQENALRLVRENLAANRPLVNAGSTDEDLIKALEKPKAALYASRMCGVQILRRNPRMSPEQAFNFGPAELGRDRVYAHLWAGEGWSPRVAKTEKYARTRKLEHV